MAKPNAKCAACAKTAYPLESVTAADKVYHKLCFKCEECKSTLNIKSFKAFEGKTYCSVHVPVSRSTAIDSVTNQTALKAPKRVAEGLGQAQKGTGETPKIGLDSVTTKAALSAPKVDAGRLGTHKGSHDTAPEHASFDHSAPEQHYEAPSHAAAAAEPEHYEEEAPAEEAAYGGGEEEAYGEEEAAGGDDYAYE